MGVNLIRYWRDPFYRAVKRWKWAKGDDTLRFSAPVPPGGVVLDIGAYIGEFAAEAARRWNARVIGFEPVPAYAALAQEANAGHPRVTIHAYGLGAEAFTAPISIEGLASSTYRQAGETIDAAFHDIVAELELLGEERIALAKINIEGGEYDILPRLIESGWITRIDALMIQFHQIDAGSQARYDAIAAELARTHGLSWRYPFVWELWVKGG